MTFNGLHIGDPLLLLFEGLICPYEMYNGNGTSLTPFSTPSGTNTITNCRQQCDSVQICQAYTFASGTCKLYQTAPTESTITAAAGSTLNIKKCIYPDGRNKVLITSNTCIKFCDQTIDTYKLMNISPT